MKTLELTTHREGGINLIANDGKIYGQGPGANSALRSACFAAQRAGYERIRLDSGDSFDVAAKIAELDNALFGAR